MAYDNNLSIAGRMMQFEGIILLIPLFVLIFFRDEGSLAGMFIVPALVSMVGGFIVCLMSKKRKKLNSDRVVLFSWIYGFILAAIPFYLYGNVSFVQAIFESVSGFTTTGLSVLDVENTPSIFLFYRSFLQYVGGLGFVMTMLIFVQGKYSIDLFKSEGHPDNLMPNIGRTAKVIFFMYSFFLVIGTMMYVACNMPIFDSIMHTMCALSTGGFSNRLDSIGYYNSVSIELVTVFLMFIGTTNFSILLLLFKGRVRDFFRASEVKFLGVIIILLVPLMTLFLVHGGETVFNGLRQSFFNAFSALSTTGYATCNYAEWPETATAVLILMMIIGGGIGSTAGGIKLGRVCIVLKKLWVEIKRKVKPDRTVMMAYYDRGYDKEVLTEDITSEASTYMSVYIILYIMGTLAFTYFAGCTLIEGGFEFASALGTVGLSIGITNGSTSAICLIIEIIGMILGRLEIFVILKAFVKKR